MRRCLLAISIVIISSAASAAACLDPSALAGSTVGITRVFSDEDRQTEAGTYGIRGTAWFLGSQLMVTAAHVADAMQLSANQWKELQIRERNSEWLIPARMVRITGLQSEKMAVLELKSPVPNATTLQIRREPLVPEESVVSSAYPNNTLRFARGRFVEFKADGGLAGAALLEMYDGNDRLVLDHGASGAPILDCKGKVVAVVSIAITQRVSLLSSGMRTSTAWQTPNVVSIPIGSLTDVFPPD